MTKYYFFAYLDMLLPWPGPIIFENIKAKFEIIVFWNGMQITFLFAVEVVTALVPLQNKF